jgi:signal transduction histidine kinase/DNA-binding response OmpR family regulator
MGEMNDTVSGRGFRRELRGSATPACVVLFAVAVFAAYVPDLRNPLVVPVALAAGGLIVVSRATPVTGKWGVVVTAALAVGFSAYWHSAPDLLPLLFAPVALAGVLIGLPAALVVALGATAAIVAPALLSGIPPDPLATGVALACVWVSAGVVAMAYLSVYRFADWAWDYYRKTQDQVEEALQRKLALEQALEDLARVNQQLTRLNAIAQGLRRAAEEAQAAKQQFVANVSHELRTPLNMVIGFSEMILSSPKVYGRSRVPPALLADLKVIHRNAAHLSELVDDVLDLSQIEADRMALTKEYARIEELVEAAATAVRPLYDSKGLYLHSDVAGDLPPVFCDATRIREVLLNLLSNAGRFTEVGGVIVRARRERGDLVVSVADTGRGIEPADLDKLFQPFSQLDSSLSKRYGGTGLGLSISRRFVELHGGEISAESAPGNGTTFTFRIPFAPAVPSPVEASRWLEPGWEYLQRTRPSSVPRTPLRPRYLVLEQGEALQRLLTRHLHDQDIELVPVKSLEAVAEAIAREPSDVLLMNVPSVPEGLRSLREASLPEDLPVLVCSIPSTIDASAALGAAGLLIKPISSDDLFAALDRLQLGRGTVLIVDDEPDVLQLFGRMLAASGGQYRVLQAQDGQEALSLMADYRPDAILLDLVMPNMDGFQFLERMGQDARLADIPVIVISARDPVGQPIMSSALAITQSRGLSARQLLAGIQFLVTELAATGRVAGPMRSEALPG